MNTKSLKVAAAVTMLSIAGMNVPTAAHAGGCLFGAHCVIGGSVGTFVQKNVNPVATPIVQGAVVGTGAVAGGIVGGYVGAPVTGAAIGGAVGNGFNNCAAGHC